MNVTRTIIGVIAAVASSCFFLLDLGQQIPLTALKTKRQLLMDMHGYFYVSPNNGAFARKIPAGSRPSP